ncbi:MAG: peroxiredoxin [Pseudomonadota bacterium]
MALTVGDALPDATFTTMGAEGPSTVSVADIAAQGRAVIFGLPGAYTGTCTTAHVPSFIRNIDALKAKGVDAVYCLAVNDVFVMQAWGESTGATAAGIVMLSDADAAFTKAIGMEFTAPPVGLIDRSKRYAMVVEGGKVTLLNEDENPGVCDISAAEAVLDAL